MKMNSNFLTQKNAENGDIIEILNEGEWVESNRYKYEDGNPRRECMFSVKHNDEEKNLRMNKTSRTAMIDAFGDESKDWIGKKAKIELRLLLNNKDKAIILHPIVNGTKDIKNEEVEAWDE